VVLGGPSVVSDAQLAKLGAYTTGTVQRIYGSDRYATAAAVSRATFASGVAVAYVASGTTFPDALAGGAAAGMAGAPVLLTGATSSVPAATRNELARLKPGRIVVVGGSGVIPNGQLSVLDGFTTGSVTRVAGADRYATAVAVSQAGFAADAPGTVYLATGTLFPDGLAGAAPAARARGPLLLTTPTSLPDAVAAELRRLNPSTVVVLGGSGSVSTTVINQIRSLWD
jgi:putative cell wall-binding protein